MASSRKAGAVVLTDSISFYDKNASEFLARTIDVDMSGLYERFLPLVCDGGLILDAGCGSGRDSKAFLDRGFEVEAIDASAAMVEATSSHTGIRAKRMTFEEIDWVDRFDGVWACASLVHTPYEDFQSALQKLVNAAKPRAPIYVSVKNGGGPANEGERQFFNYTEQRFRDALNGVLGHRISEIWVTDDSRADKERPRWLNAICIRV